MIRGERTELRPVTEADLDLLAGWFAAPEIYRYWGGRPLGRDEVAAKYIGRRRPEVESLIVEHEGLPIGYLQWWLGEDQLTGGLDMFLVPEARGQGLGPDAARAAARYLAGERGWRRITVDPLRRNDAAIRAWERAGFRFEREIVGDEGPALLLVYAG